jgi:methyl-accepting chemotaxis protein
MPLTINNNSSIRFRFVLIFSIVFIGFLIIGYAYKTVLMVNAGIEQAKTEVLHISELINQLELDIQLARQFEKNYLMKQDIRYLAKHNEILADAYEKISLLNNMLKNEADDANTGNGTNLSVVLETMQKLISEYESGFQFVADAKQKRLSAIQIIYDLAKSVEEKILATDNLVLINSYLKMRGYEKDYVASSDYQHVTQLNYEMKEFALNLIDADLDDSRRNEISKLMNEYNLGMLALTNGTTTVATRITGFNEIVGKLDPLMTELKNSEKQKFEADIELAQASISRSNNLFILTIAAIGVFVLIFLFNTARYITRQIDGLIAAIKQLSKGDLTIELFETRDTDEISRLYNSLYIMKLRLTNVINGIRSSAGAVSSASEQVAQGNMDLSQRTQEQASSLEEMASSMEEMTGTVTQNAENANKASELAMNARLQAERGGEVVGRVVSAMSGINLASHRIADIITVIDGIAFQTNLLALNAAVEAARAGEHGRSFAVVANEVRNLAGRCKTAAREIRDLVMDTMEKVKSGTQLADESGKALTDIVQSVKKVSDIIAEIAAASSEQSDGIIQINKSLIMMDDMTQQNAALMEQAAASSEAMQNQAHALHKLVEYFQVDDAGVATAQRYAVIQDTQETLYKHNSADPVSESKSTRENRKDNVTPEHFAAFKNEEHWEKVKVEGGAYLN